MTIKKNIRFLPISLIAVLLVVGIIRLSNLDFTSFVYDLREMPILAGMVIIALFAIKSVLIFIPIFVLYFSAGLVFPIHLALVICLIGLFIEMSIGYYFGKKLGRTKIQAKLRKNKRISEFLDKQANLGAEICFIMRLTPLPFDLVNQYFGALEMDFWQYIFYSYLGLIPALVAYIFMGESVLNPLSIEFLLPFSGMLLISFIGFLLFRKMKKN
jgi:uncharacterized membrane protein YdjX (TVP38/TMEM64 family)